MQGSTGTTDTSGTTSPTTTVYPPTDRTVPTRAPGRASYDRDVVHSILD
ncbi:pyridoxamine 5'-phosphate oxidase family protein, partial [Streptomyces sp. TRM76130]|nr:pyridoxamine 5'-phosphate oxidase family protein [Streptomyces sp. TRM76130]